MPSAVFWPTEGALALFGRVAIAAHPEGEEGRLMRGLRSTLGSSLIHAKATVGSRAVSFREALSRFIGHLRAVQKAAASLDTVVLGALSTSSIMTRKPTLQPRRPGPKLPTTAAGHMRPSNPNPLPQRSTMNRPRQRKNWC